MPDHPVQKVLFILNPLAGGKPKYAWEKGIRDFFKTSPHQFEIYDTTGRNDQESIRYWINSWHPDKVVVVGGDGTLKKVAEVLIGTGIPICIFPAGSSNGMARELEMPANPSDCLHILFEGVIKTIDILRINDTEVCIHLSDIGINAQLVKYFEENDMRGKIGYAKEIFRVLWRKRLMNLNIKKGGENLIRTAFMVVIANASMYGTGAKINPLGALDDGLFEVIILRKLSLIELLKMLFLNRPFNPKKTEVLQAESLTIEVRKRAYFQIDGEYLGRTKKISAQVQASALNVIIPKKNENR